MIDSYIKKWCKGFSFDDKFTTIKNGTTVLVTWHKGDSKVDSVVNCEIFGRGKHDKMTFWQEVWTGNLKYTKTKKSVTAKVKFSVRTGVTLPQTVLLRTWGYSKKGPKCLTYT